VLDAPVELVVAGRGHVYAQVGRRLEARRAAGEGSESPARREAPRVRPDGRLVILHGLYRALESLPAGEGAVGGRRRRVRAAEIVGGDDPDAAGGAHRDAVPLAAPRIMLPILAVSAVRGQRNHGRGRFFYSAVFAVD
jgi:hypothetical protein